MGQNTNLEGTERKRRYITCIAQQYLTRIFWFFAMSKNKRELFIKRKRNKAKEKTCICLRPSSAQSGNARHEQLERASSAARRAKAQEATKRRREEEEGGDVGKTT